MTPESTAELCLQAPSTLCGATNKASASLEVGPPTPSPGGPSILPPVKEFCFKAHLKYINRPDISCASTTRDLSKCRN